MKNIKSVEVIKSLTGLEQGDVLTRKDSNSNFELNVETVTETYSAKRFISLSEELLNKEEFKAIEWFTPKITNKQARERLEILETRIETKLAEYKAKFAEIDEKLKEDKYLGELIEWADEAQTVYHNLIDLLEKIKA